MDRWIDEYTYTSMDTPEAVGSVCRSIMLVFSSRPEFFYIYISFLLLKKGYSRK